MFYFPAHQRSTSLKTRRVRVSVASVKFVQGSDEGLTHSELLLKSGPLICIKSVFEILSPKQTVFMQSERSHLFAHANQQHPNLALTCNFSIIHPQKTQAFLLVI